MLRHRKLIALAAFGALAAGPALAAAGTPQRSSTPPPGLLKVFARGVPGIVRAVVVTEGSNSRLQELPASP